MSELISKHGDEYMKDVASQHLKKDKSGKLTKER
jgi:hypothetical protein